MNKPLNIFFLLFLLCFCCETKSQTNLVPNGSFEIYDTCPQYPNQLHLAKGWYKPTIASSDYFNSCDLSGYMSPPNNFYGFKSTFHGEAYAGFGFTNNYDYAEYIACKLITPLKPNYTYSVSFYLALSGKSNYAVNSIGMYLSKDSIYDNDPNGFALTSYTPQIVSNQFITDTLNWTKVYGLYNAIGDENYIVIGNFKPYYLTDTLKSYGVGFFGTYYFIDSIGIYSDEDVNNIPNIYTPNGDGVNDVWRYHFSSIINCTIYNRWGNKIYTTTNHEIIWDGRTTSGEECNDGYYYYLIHTETENYKGFIQLIR